MTASSVTVADGDPWRLLLVVSDTADIFEALTEPGRFVVQMLEDHDQALADRLAGLTPAPGGLFRGIETEATAFGARLARAETWAGCVTESVQPVGYQHLVIARIEEVTVHELEAPLVYYRGRYRTLAGP